LASRLFGGPETNRQTGEWGENQGEAKRKERLVAACTGALRRGGWADDEKDEPTPAKCNHR